MPLYVADYLGDTMHLTTLQHGAYVLLLMHYWRTGPLPDDQDELAAIVKLDEKAWKGVWAKLCGFFTANGDGRLHQKRMDWERRRWTDISDKRRDAGKRGAEAKHRSPTNNSGAPPTPKAQPALQPEVVPLTTTSGSQYATTSLAIATDLPPPLPVDNLANARNLPPDLPEPLPPISGNCQDFATHFASVPLPLQREELYLSLGKEAAREGKTANPEQNPLADEAGLSRDALYRKSSRDALPPSGAASEPPVRRHTLDVQRKAVAKPERPKACHLAGAHLAAMRKQAGIWRRHERRL